MDFLEIIIGTIGLASNYLIYRWLLIVARHQDKSLKIPGSLFVFWLFIILGQAFLVFSGFMGGGFGEIFGF
jgi:hypothetical protein